VVESGAREGIADLVRNPGDQAAERPSEVGAGDIATRAIIAAS
jgi:hypothetical protein